MAMMDEDVVRDDTVGETIMSVGDLIVNGGVNTWFEIYYKKKSAGSVHLSTTWKPSAQKQKNLVEETKEFTKEKIRQV